MRKSLILLAVPTLAVVLAVAALAVVPGAQNALSQGPSATSISAPTWKVGDRWTYNVSMASIRAEPVLPSSIMANAPVPVGSVVGGTLSEAVVGSVSTPSGSAWNETVDGSLAFGPPRPIIMTQPIVQTLSMPVVRVSGFVWLRQSDLALVYSLKSVNLSRNWTPGVVMPGSYGMLANATYTLTYDATTQIWYQPALAIWHFPLEENATWNVSSNATIRYASSFQVLGPNVTYEAHHFANFTVPVDFTMRTGRFEDVTTPAGTFHALPAWASRGTLLPGVPDRDASAVTNLTGETDLEMPHTFATAWFSAQAGNVVRADFWTGFLDGPRIEMDLVSYTFS